MIPDTATATELTLTAVAALGTAWVVVALGGRWRAVRAIRADGRNGAVLFAAQTFLRRQAFRLGKLVLLFFLVAYPLFTRPTNPRYAGLPADVLFGVIVLLLLLYLLDQTMDGLEQWRMGQLVDRTGKRERCTDPPAESVAHRGATERET